METKRINLSEPTEFQLRNTVIKVYPLCLEKVINLNPKLMELSKIQDLSKQAELFCEVVFEVIREDNDIKKEDLKKILTIEAGMKIVQKALGNLDGFVPQV